MDWHQKGNALLAGSSDGTLWLWNANNGDYLASFAGHDGPLTCGLFTPDGTKILTASEDNSIKIWNPKTGELVK